MRLQRLRTVSKKVRTIRGAVGLTLALQPLLALLSPIQSAFALNADTPVVINEIAPVDPNDQWVELYNTSATTVDLTGWQLRFDDSAVSTPLVSGAEIVGHSWYVIALNASIPTTSTGTSLRLYAGPSATDPIADEVSNWNVTGANQSYGRIDDGSSQWTTTPSTKGASNSALNESQVAIERFATVNGAYKGVEVGFTGSHFGAVSAVEVDILRADGSHVVKRANQGVLDAMSSAVDVHVTAPFVIQEGSYTESGDTDSWQPADPTEWTSSTMPTSVTVIVTDESGTKQAFSDTFDQPVPYGDLLPVVTPPRDTDPPLITVNGEAGVVVGKSISLTIAANEPLAVLHVYVGNDELLTGLTQLSETSWSVLYTPAAAGVYTFRANGEDTSGNLSQDAYFSVVAKVMVVAVPPTIEQTTAATKQLQAAVAALSQPLNTVTDIEPIITPHDSNSMFPKSGVLQSADIASGDSGAAIVSTGSGWKIFGILWYWWGLIVAGLVAVGWRFNRHLQRVAE